jgi:hypothetical protein
MLNGYVASTISMLLVQDFFTLEGGGIGRLLLYNFGSVFFVRIIVLGPREVSNSAGGFLCSPINGRTASALEVG